MKSRLVMLMSLAIAALSVALAAGQVHYSMSSPPPVHATLKAHLASYLGVFEPGSPPSYDPIADFAAAAGRKPDMAGYFSGWVERFDSAFAETLHSNGVIPYVQIDPTDASIAAIADGDYDDYLTTYADSVRAFGKPVIIGFGHEMNAPWYSWGYGHVPAATFVAAWRHLVTVFRQQGADNVTWLWTIQADETGTGPIAAWWPGPQYVNWVGIDGFYYGPTDTFDRVFGRTIAQVRVFTNRPVLLSETAVGPGAGQYVKIVDLFEGMAKAKTLGLVWFDYTQHGGADRQDWRIEDNRSAGLAFQLGVHVYLAPAGSART
jgi:mannan endo-1,4-beta-mannosidase